MGKQKFFADPEPTVEAPAAQPGETKTGRRNLCADVTPDTWKAWNALAAERGVTRRAQVIEALNLLFERYEKPPIAR